MPSSSWASPPSSALSPHPGPSASIALLCRRCQSELAASQILCPDHHCLRADHSIIDVWMHLSNRVQAEKIAAQLGEEDGAARGCEVFHQHLPVQALRGEKVA